MLPSHWLGNHRSCKEALLSFSIVYVEHRRHSEPLQCFSYVQVAKNAGAGTRTTHCTRSLACHISDSVLKICSRLQSLLGRLSRVSESASSLQGCVSSLLHNGKGSPAPERCLTAHCPSDRKKIALGIRTSSKIDTMSTGKASDYKAVSQRYGRSEHCGCYPGFIKQFFFLWPYDLAEFLIVQAFKELMVRLLIASFLLTIFDWKQRTFS